MNCIRWTMIFISVAVVELKLNGERSVELQLYSPLCEVWRGLNLRSPLDIVMSLPLLTTPAELYHVTRGVSEVSPTILPVQVSVYICPATGLPEVLMLIMCTETEKKQVYGSN